MHRRIWLYVRRYAQTGTSRFNAADQAKRSRTREAGVYLGPCFSIPHETGISAVYPPHGYSIMWLGLPITTIDFLGYIAAFLVFLTFCMKTLIMLRAIAIMSNFAFIAYAFSADLGPILLLHGALFPMNAFRLWENLRLAKRVRNATREHPNMQVLLPLMQPLELDDGQEVFRKGDDADRLFYIKKGKILIVEFDKLIEAGEMFGEIGLFARGQCRTATARSVGQVELGQIDRKTVLRISQEHPEFMLTVARLVTDRLIENQSELVARLAALES